VLAAISSVRAETWVDEPVLLDGFARNGKVMLSTEDAQWLQVGHCVFFPWLVLWRDEVRKDKEMDIITRADAN
jgi:hypothetical protein